MHTAWRLDRADIDDMQAVLDLIRGEFAYMDGLIDPPTSMHRLTLEDLITGPEEVWAVGQPPIACMVMAPKAEALYVGKLAVASSRRNRGFASHLIEQAERRAGELGLHWLELQTRIELTDNQRTFTTMGFQETERTSHPGYTRPTSITYRRAVSNQNERTRRY